MTGSVATFFEYPGTDRFRILMEMERDPTYIPPEMSDLVTRMLTPRDQEEKETKS